MSGAAKESDNDCPNAQIWTVLFTTQENISGDRV